MKTTHAHAVGPCPNCGHGNATPDGRLTVPCSNCGTKITLKRVIGVYTDARNCDSACLGAVRNVCACNCGGANHGRGYSPGTYVGDVADWDLARAQQRNAKRHTDTINNRQAKAQAKIDKLHGDIDALLSEHPALSFLIDDEYMITKEGRSSDFYWSIAEKLIKWGNLSEKQIAAVERGVIRQQQWKAEDDARAAEVAKLIDAGVKVPSGRVKIIGTVVFVKVDEYDVWGQPYKMTVQSDDGWRVYGSVPASLRQARPNDAPPLKEWLKGKRVEIIAGVKPKDGDPLFGYINRPTGAKII